MLLWAAILILALLWLVGFLYGIGGGAIHLLLVVLVVVLIVGLIQRSRAI